MLVDYVGMLEKFHQKYGHYIYHGYQVGEDTIELRIKLIQEEVNEELIPVLLKLKNPELDREEWFDLMVELSDALADSLYVIFGTAVTMGVPINQVFAEVQRSNMTKSMEKDTKSIKGKTLKGEDYSPPNIREVLLRNLV